MRNLVQKLDTFFHSANPANTVTCPHNNSLTALQLSAEDDASTLEEANNPHDECTSSNCICVWMASRIGNLKPDTKPLKALEVLADEIHEAVLKARNIKVESKGVEGSLHEDLEAKAILEKVENLRRCVQYRLVMQAARSDETSTPPYSVHSEHFGNSKSSVHSSNSNLYHLTTLDYFKPTFSKTLSSAATIKQPPSKELEPTFPYPDISIPFSTNHSMKSQTDLRNSVATFEYDAPTVLDGAGDYLVNNHSLNAGHDVGIMHTLANVPQPMADLSGKVRNRISARTTSHRRELNEDVDGLRDALAGVKFEAHAPSKQASRFLKHDPAIGTEHYDEVAESSTKIGETLERFSSHLKDQVES